jgi:peptidylprolyl isomerase
MSQAEDNSTVRIHFTGKLNDGTVVATSEGSDPIEFVVGSRTLIPGIEKAVTGMNVGDTKTETLQPEDAFGNFRDELITTIGRDAFPEGSDLSVGQSFESSGPDGQNRIITIIDIKGDEVTIDGNHPLAGKEVTFDIELVEVL